MYVVPVTRSCGAAGMGAMARERALMDSGEMRGGSNLGNAGGVMAEDLPSHGQAQSLSLILPPLATIVLSPGALNTHGLTP